MICMCIADYVCDVAVCSGMELAVMMETCNKSYNFLSGVCSTTRTTRQKMKLVTGNKFSTKMQSW